MEEQTLEFIPIRRGPTAAYNSPYQFSVTAPTLPRDYAGPDIFDIARQQAPASGSAAEPKCEAPSEESARGDMSPATRDPRPKRASIDRDRGLSATALTELPAGDEYPAERNTHAILWPTESRTEGFTGREFTAEQNVAHGSIIGSGSSRGFWTEDSFTPVRPPPYTYSPQRFPVPISGRAPSSGLPGTFDISQQLAASSTRAASPRPKREASTGCEFSTDQNAHGMLKSKSGLWTEDSSALQFMGPVWPPSNLYHSSHRLAAPVTGRPSSGAPGTFDHTARQVHASATSEDFAGTTAYSTSNQYSHNTSDSGNTASSDEDGRGWVEKTTRFLIGKCGRWSSTFVLWTMGSGVLEIGLVSWQLALSIGYFTSHEIVLSAASIFAAIYSMLLACHAVRTQNIFEVYGAIFFSAVVLVAAIIQDKSEADLCRIYDAIQDSPTPVPTNDPTTWYAKYIVGVSYNSLETWGDRVQSLRMATCVATGLHLFGQVMLLPGIWREVKWKVFKKIGADRKMRWRYSAFNLLVVQCKVNVYFAGLAGAYFISHGWWSYSHTFLIITSAGYLVYTSGLIMLQWAVQKEKFAPVIVFLFLALLIEGILMVQLVKLWPILPFTVDKYFLIREVGSFLCVFNIFLLAACMLTATLCTLNFGGGLQKFVDASASDTGKASKGSGSCPRTESTPSVVTPTGEWDLRS